MFVLKISNLSKGFGGLWALKNLYLEVKEGTITSIIGPNGAGKTTLFNCLTGFNRPTEGQITFNGKSITGLSPHKITQLGIARTFQNIRLFPTLSVIDNVITGSHIRRPYGFVRAILRDKIYRIQERLAFEDAYHCLDMLGLLEYANAQAGTLPYGLQKRLELARALATRPQILLLDEPSAGMNPSETAYMMEKIKTINLSGVAILLIEHDMHLVMNLSDHVMVLNYGVKIAEGRPEEIRENSAVIEAYLGTGGNTCLK